nr:EOG090X07KM [Sida crystallina]
MLLKKELGLEGKVVLITGASSGLGEALAHAFYSEGCKIILCARQKAKLEQVREHLLSSGNRQGNVYPPVIIQIDLEELNSLDSKMETAIGVYGHVDILVNNGGISYRGEITDTTLEVDVRLMKTNYFGSVALTKALLPSMIQRKSGHILMIGSVQSKLAIPFRSAYSASKHALQAFSDSLRAEVNQHNIKVTVVNPGYIKTNLSLNALTGSGQLYGHMDPTTESGLDPAVAANSIIAAVKNGKCELMLCSLFYRFIVLLRVLFPGIFFWAMARRASKFKKEA